MSTGRKLGIVERLSALSGVLGTVALAFIVVSTLYDVIVRYVFAAPTFWAFEVNTFLLAFLCTIPAADGLRTNSHIRVVFGMDKLAPRTKFAMSILRGVTGILFCGAMTYVGAMMAWEAWKYGDRMSTTLGTPMVIPYLFIPVGFFLLGLQYIVFLMSRSIGGEDAPGAEVHQI